MGASPVLRAFADELGRVLSLARPELSPRQDGLAPALARTAGRPDLDARAAWMAADWLVRVSLADWLALAGLTAHADALAAAPAIDGPGRLPAARIEAARALASERVRQQSLDPFLAWSEATDGGLADPEQPLWSAIGACDVTGSSSWARSAMGACSDSLALAAQLAPDWAGEWIAFHQACALLCLECMLALWHPPPPQERRIAALLSAPRGERASEGWLVCADRLQERSDPAGDAIALLFPHHWGIEVQMWGESLVSDWHLGEGELPESQLRELALRCGALRSTPGQRTFRLAVHGASR